MLLAVMVAVSSSWTKVDLDKGIGQIAALNTGFHSAFVGASIIAIVGALIALLFSKWYKLRWVPGRGIHVA